MSNDMTGPGTGGGVLSSLGDRMMGRASGSHAKVSKKSGPLDGLFLSQLIPALLLVLAGTITIWTASLTIADANFPAASIASHCPGGLIRLDGFRSLHR